MGRRTIREPTTEDSFLWRVCHALDEHPTELAKSAGVAYKELKPLLSKDLLVEMDRDDTWLKLMDYVDKRLGLILAVKQELNIRLEREMLKRLKRTERFKEL